MLIVDPITEAMWSLPKEVTVTLSEKDFTLKNEEGKILKIVAINQVPEDLKDKLIKIQ